jgi:hypothetical protein
MVSLYNQWLLNLRYKARLNAQGLLSMCCSTDKKWKPEQTGWDPDVIKDAHNKQVKRIIFLRHGESTWNNIFNKGLKMLLPRLIIAVIKEMTLLITKASLFSSHCFRSCVYLCC